jgi:hypothetical protein
MVNEIGQLDGVCEALPDPHELASWVKEIDGLTTILPR